jgi:Protein of unknown function (DUF3108)
LKTFPIILTVFSILHAVTAQQTTDATATSFNSQAYRVGERLTYDVSFSQFVSAAHVELLVAARGTFFGREGIELRAHAETTGLVNVALFAVNNDYVTYVDPASGLPYRAQQVIRQAGRASDTSSEYNQPAGTDAIPSKLRTGESPGTYDLLSAIYRVRALPLTEGSSYFISVRHEGETYRAELKLAGRQMVKTKVGSFSALVGRLNVNHSSLNNYGIRIYFSDDERHIPVLITGKLPAGEIRAELAGSEMKTGTPPKPQPSPSPIKPPGPIIVPPTATDNLRASLPFKVGEQLNFRIYMPGISEPVGTVLFEVRAHGKYFDRDGLLLSAKAQTAPAGSRLFVVNDQVTSYVDPTSLLPFRTEFAMVEGGRKTNRIYTVDQDRGSAALDNSKRIEIPVGTHDLISLVYAARTFDLTPPKRNAISVLLDDRPITLFITSLRRETIDLGGQKVPAVQLSLTTDDPQSDKYQLRAWVSDDIRRLPLRFAAMTPLGPLRIDLVILPVTSQ